MAENPKGGTLYDRIQMRTAVQPVRLPGANELPRLHKNQSALLGRHLPGKGLLRAKGTRPLRTVRGLPLQLASDPQQGDDGARIEQCKRWRDT